MQHTKNAKIAKNKTKKQKAKNKKQKNQQSEHWSQLLLCILFHVLLLA
jgi:hypothetical protein